ncbi:hypothetical protein [Nitrosomonas marina]|uniref:Uncharacterized protein n=1 Tax=Nitrosomonas marina TaxID=917 RepID=A0A1H8GK93_9PROT|nr:hypothetical protein [Nitrosomonas marina]SEN43728.1 hypothetical protein SAMN05216325_11839 [Nitrosomonas marina]
MIDENCVESRLTRWARIKMQTGVKLGFPERSAFMNMTPAGSDPVIDPGVDLEFQQTDLAYNQLPEIPKLVIRKEFLSTCKNEASKAYQLGIAIRTFRQYKHNAYKLMANLLNAHLTHDAEKVYKSANL